MVETVSERELILLAASKLTTGDRNKSYGDPIDQLGLAGKLKNLFRYHAKRDIGPAEQEAIDSVLLKVSRLAHGYKRDNYVDGAAYFAIAGEVAELEKNDEDA